MADFMVRDDFLFFRRNDRIFALVPSNDSLDRLLQIALRNGAAAFTDGAEAAFIDDIRQLGTGSTGSGAGDRIVINIWIHFVVRRMHLQDRFTSCQVRQFNRYATVKTTWAQ